MPQKLRELSEKLGLTTRLYQEIEVVCSLHSNESQMFEWAWVPEGHRQVGFLLGHDC